MHKTFIMRAKFKIQKDFGAKNENGIRRKKKEEGCEQFYCCTGTGAIIEHIGYIFENDIIIWKFRVYLVLFLCASIIFLLREDWRNWQKEKKNPKHFDSKNHLKAAFCDKLSGTISNRVWYHSQSFIFYHPLWMTSNIFNMLHYIFVKVFSLATLRI